MFGFTSASAFPCFFLTAVVDFSPVNSVSVHCLCDPQTSLFSNFFIKNGSHGTIHTFKNYFATVFSVFNKNKLYPNNPLVYTLRESSFYSSQAFHLVERERESLSLSLEQKILSSSLLHFSHK